MTGFHHSVSLYIRNSVPALLLTLITGTMAYAQELKISSTVQPENAVVGQTIIYVVRVQSSAQDFTPPKPPVFDPGSGISPPTFAGTQTQLTIVNGAASHAIEYRWHFSGSRPGKIVIPGAVVEREGKRYFSDSITLNINARPVNTAIKLPAELEGRVAPAILEGNPQLESQLYGAVFILHDTTTTSPYNGEQVRVSYHLVLDPVALQEKKLIGQRNWPRQERVKFPQLDQFLKEELFPLPTEGLRFREHMFGGKKYYVTPLYEVAISSTKTGKQTIDPFQLSMLFTAEVDSRERARRGVAIDPFGEDIFGFGNSQIEQMMGMTRSIRIVAQSQPIELEVRPLPAQGRPADFSGAVGNFNISTQLDRDSAVANEEEIKLSVTIEGTGDANSLSAPKLPPMPAFKQLGEPASSTTSRKENNDLISTKKFEYVLRPLQAGEITIPPIVMATFDPKAEEYTRIESNPSGINVKPGTRPAPAPVAAAAVHQTPSAGDNSPVTAPAETDLRYIHTGTLTFTGEGGVFNPVNPMYVILAGLPPLMMLAGFLAGRKNKRLAGGPDRSRRQRKAAEVARRHLRSSEKLMNSEDRSGFFAELSRALRGYFGDRYNLDPSDLTISQIEEKLESTGAGKETSILVRTLLDRCDAARYSPITPDLETARAAYSEAELLLSQVESRK